MTKEELQKQKAVIISRIDEIQSSMPFLTEETKPVVPSVSLGRLTRMEAISEKGVNEHILSRNKQTLQRLENALIRLEKGTYGACVRCGGEIPMGRLQHVPEALLCIPCAEKK